MFSLIPREMDFFELFEKGAANVHEASILLVKLLEDYTDVPEKAKKIKDVEHRGDSITHETIERLNKTFITPIDREDVHELVSRLDDIVDLMDTAVNRMVLYKIAKPEEDALRLGRCLQHATGLLQEAMPLLRNMKNSASIMEKCRAVHTQENEADRIEQHALASLFESGQDPIEVIKWKDVYQDLEAATDRCEDVANVLEGIVLKNA